MSVTDIDKSTHSLYSLFWDRLTLENRRLTLLTASTPSHAQARVLEEPHPREKPDNLHLRPLGPLHSTSFRIKWARRPLLWMASPFLISVRTIGSAPSALLPVAGNDHPVHGVIRIERLHSTKGSSYISWCTLTVDNLFLLVSQLI